MSNFIFVYSSSVAKLTIFPNVKIGFKTIWKKKTYFFFRDGDWVRLHIVSTLGHNSHVKILNKIPNLTKYLNIMSN